MARIRFSQYFRFHTEMLQEPNGTRCSAKQIFFYTQHFVCYTNTVRVCVVWKKNHKYYAMRALTFKKKPRPWIYNITPLSFTARWCDIEFFVSKSVILGFLFSVLVYLLFFRIYTHFVYENGGIVNETYFFYILRLKLLSPSNVRLK